MLGAHLVFADESGFQLTPSIACAWAPVGQTPTVHHFDRRDRISAISGISVSPRRQRLNLHFQLYTENIRQLQASDFLRQLLRQLPGHTFVLSDGANPDRGKLVRKLCARTKRIHLRGRNSKTSTVVGTPLGRVEPQGLTRLRV